MCEMARQIVNTRGMDVTKLRELLRAKINYATNIQCQISRLQESLDYRIIQKEQIEKEINYLEKFIARKEKQK
jgi:hypothetical protein